MVIVSKKIELDYGHTLPNHFSFCNQIHGHRAVIIAEVEGKINSEKGSSSQGMVLDFTILKKLMMDKIHSILDHGFAVWKDDMDVLLYITKRNTKYLITNEPPTSECLSKWAFYQLKNELPKGINLKKITWYETPNSCSIYTEEDSQ